MDEPNHNQLPPSTASVSASSSSSALSLSSSSNHWYPHPCSSSPTVALAEGELLQDDVEGVPRPLESLHSTPLPQFLTKIYELVQDPTLDRVLSWEAKGESFVVWDTVQLSRSILPQHFKHSNFSSFVRQLNTYGFRKTGTNSWEFANGDFRRGKKELLKNIRRRRSSSSLTSRSHVLTPPGTCYSTGGVPNAMVRKSRLDYEVETLTSEGDVMMSELAKLQEEHVTTRHKMESVRQRMQSAEQKQKRIVFFLWKVLQSAVIFPGHNHRRNHHLKHQSKTIITSAEPTTNATWPHYETEDFVHFDTVTSKQLPDEDDNANVLQGILEHTIADASAETLKDIHVPEGGEDEDARLLLLSPLVGHMDDNPTDAAVAWREACNVMNSHGNDRHNDVSHNDDEYVSRGKSVLVYGEEEKEQEGMMTTRMTGGAASNGCDHTTFWSMNFDTAQTPVIPRRLDVHDPAAPLEIEHEGCSSFTLPDDVWLPQQVDQMIWISENTEAGDFHCGS